MTFDCKPFMHAQEAIYFELSRSTKHFVMIFNKSCITQTTSQTGSGMFLESKSSFNKRLNYIASKVMKLIRSLHKIQTFYIKNH